MNFLFLTSKLCQRLPGTLLIVVVDVPVGAVPVEHNHDHEQGGDRAAGRGRAVPGQDPAGHVHRQHPEGGDGGGEGQEPAPVVAGADLPHVDLNTEEVSAPRHPQDESGGLEQAGVGGDGGDHPPNHVRHGQEHQTR